MYGLYKGKSVRSSMIGLLRSLVLGSVAATLVACGGGGGGGSGGGVPGGPDPANEYQIRLTASQTAIPLNILPDPCVNPPSPWAPYATTLYVEAFRKGTGDPIPGGEDVFACNVREGLDNGALYYFRGRDEDKVEVLCGDEDVEIEGAWRSITLDANSGGNSFHLLASNRAGQVVVRCTVTDPQNNQQVHRDIAIQVGGSTNVPSQVRVNFESLHYLFAQGTGGQTQVQLQVEVLDDLHQRVPNPPLGVNNVYARIVPTGSPATVNAKLRGTGVDNSWVAVRTINGQAQFSVISGGQTGSLLIEVMSDRLDNNVDNGISQVVTNLVSIPVVASVGQTALAVPGGDLPAAFEGNSYTTILSASGGVPPYAWSLLPGSSLPLGLALSPDGVITGTPRVGGTFSFGVRVQDSATLAQQAQAAYTVSITPLPPEPEPDPQPVPLQIVTSTLPNGIAATPYLAVAVASGGDSGYSWSAVSLPAGLSINANGVISGTAPAAGTYSIALTVTSGSETRTRIVPLEVVNP